MKVVSSKLFKIAGILYVAHAAAAFAIGLVLPFLRYFGVF
jgi:hypothetical protein